MTPSVGGVSRKRSIVSHVRGGITPTSSSLFFINPYRRILFDYPSAHFEFFHYMDIAELQYLFLDHVTFSKRYIFRPIILRAFLRTFFP